MAETEPVVIPITAKDNASPTLKKVNTNLREMGEKISSLGMRISAVTTLPLVGLVAGLNKVGAEASKTVADLKGNADALKMLNPATISMAKSYDELQKMMSEVNGEFYKMGATLMAELVPIMRELMPTIMGVVREIGSMVKAFSDMPAAEKKTVLTLIGIVAAAGPVITVFGQVIWTIGTIQTLLPGLAAGFSTFGASVTASLGPIGLLLASIYGLIQLINSEFGKSGIEAGKQLIAGVAGAGAYLANTSPMELLMQGGSAKGNAAKNKALWDTSHALGIKGYANGGNFQAGRPIMVGERGPEIITPGFNGSVSPMGGVTINYSPVVGAATSDDLERIGYLVEQALRRRR